MKRCDSCEIVDFALYSIILNWNDGRMGVATTHWWRASIDHSGCRSSLFVRFSIDLPRDLPKHDHQTKHFGTAKNTMKWRRMIHCFWLNKMIDIIRTIITWYSLTQYTMISNGEYTVHTILTTHKKESVVDLRIFMNIVSVRATSAQARWRASNRFKIENFWMLINSTFNQQNFS